jgi:hypothetical protein
MVYVVVLRGTQQAVNLARQQLIAASNGWQLVAEDVYLVGQPNTHAESLRNFLRRIPDVEVAVMQLAGSWATGGRADLAGWLKSAAHQF